MTPRTRSLYAYVGESHQPYQSPSKDLDMINGRISGRLPHVMGVQVILMCSTLLSAFAWVGALRVQFANLISDESVI